MHVKNNCPDAITIFIAPPSLAELHRRLVGRGTETPEAVARRFEEARTELEYIPKYDYVVVNDEIESAVQKSNAYSMPSDALPNITASFCPRCSAKLSPSDERCCGGRAA